MTFSIRGARPEDAADLVHLINQLAAYERLAHASRPDEATLAAQLAADARPRIEALVAHDTASGRCIGFALYFHNYSTFLTNFGLFLEDLFVEPDCRGQGVGFALFQALAQIARERGCQRLDWNVLDWNESAIGFYRKLGAEPLSDWVTMRLDRSHIVSLAGEN
ncbi:MAG: GNAT family N-acetyltransferase [Bacteroidetes bacterium]|nr:GNAT family N-acetyltransferase [Bacteroidota bacterium]